jgi:hypothetical protein
MTTNDSKRTGFRIANGPPTRHPEEEHASNPAMRGALAGAPLLFAIARDPRTLFTYWNLNWTDAFASGEPQDRQVQLRVIDHAGAIESEWVVEPMLGSFYAAVANPRATYRVELGYYGREGSWKSLARSEAVTMPADAVSEETAVDVATVPFHLSFQRLIDLFRESDGDPLATVLSRVQERAIREQQNSEDLDPAARQLFGAMDVSVGDLESAHAAFLEGTRDESLRKRAEALLGFGSTSPAHGFGGSSRA